MSQVNQGPSVRRLYLSSQRILILLASWLDNGDEGDESEEEEELVLVAPDGIHAVQREGAGKALIAHVEGAQEGEIGHTTHAFEG